ncbi:MAG TPA: prepilin-type N-terminal cleavage/methylation domain-containing protein [Terrimicrobiaceae bacterium]|nr:prepilin-type N-terminal cleavage/methylation domain-containing protein [Terrimicrobiaceae bacterium]
MRRAFTMIELLVVMAAIALIAFIAVPSYNIVRARADAARCLANLRAMGIGLNYFLGENQMIMPQMAAARASRTEEVAVIDNTLDRYIENSAVFTCPSGRRLAETTGTSYFWNSTLNGQPVANLNFLGLVSDLSRIPVLVDKEGWHKHTDDRVNHLFADGHATKELRLFAD